jgi:hypothetical protein
MDIDKLLAKINEIIGKGSTSLNIMQQEVDISMQVEYFEASKSAKYEGTKEELIDRRNDLFNEDISEEEKKKLLPNLAKTRDISVFRTLEKFVEVSIEPLRSWGILALNECKMMIESGLLEQSQVFISTGLGGKGLKLRYFIVLQSINKRNITEIQQKVIRNEFEFTLHKYQSEIEDVAFKNHLGTLTVLVPINISLRTMFLEAIELCNQLGRFLLEDLIVTNVKKMEFDEINDYLAKTDGEKVEIKGRHPKDALN